MDLLAKVQKGKASAKTIQKAKSYLDRLELVYTPKHGSWLDRAQIERSILQRDCLNRHIATKELLVADFSAWQTESKASPGQLAIHYQRCPSQTTQVIPDYLAFKKH
jgi:hypothetical protein